MTAKSRILKYVESAEIYLPHAYLALRDQFVDKQAFDNYYSVLSNDSQKDSFLRVASSYRFLVKDGDWQVQIEGSDPVISYITATYKLVAIFSLIESLSEIQYLDLYQWICKLDPTTVFPIHSKNDITNLYNRYNADFGSIRKCVRFFQNLPSERQKKLCQAIHIQDAALDSIEKFAKYLYELRSSFVHNTKFAVELNSCTVYSHKGNKLIECKIDMQDIAALFEEGLIQWFRQAA